ncbi:MAG: hypothetical protein Q9191_003329 [Dirinaria sp. TL-2023a]
MLCCRSLQSIAIVLTALAFLAVTNAQSVLIPQNDTFASSAQLSEQQQSDAGINDTLAENINVALEFEQSNWAGSSVHTDPFYRLPSNASHAPPGSLLKVQVYTNTSLYTLPPNTALSRILYQSRTLNGSTVPNSAYILWPYTPRTEADGYPVVGWAHGTSGAFGECAPSHVRNLWYQFAAPFTLALQGYVVVAPDYAGLGIDRDSEGKEIRHPYFANPAHANDLFYSVQAAQTAFPSLSKRFVLMGHSQGGGAAWGAAQRQALEPVDGYLGAVAGSPVTNLHDIIQLGGISFQAVGMLIANALPQIFPSFNASEILTPSGVKRYALLSQIQGCRSAVAVSFVEPELFQPDWYNSNSAKAFSSITANGGRPIAGPMLVLQGGGDTLTFPQITDNAVNKTCYAYPHSQLQYLTYPGVEHVPVLFASQVTWLNWIADRFAGVPVPRYCQSSRIPSARSYQDYQVNPNWFLEWATSAYETA